MVKSPALATRPLVDALEAGTFYASTGVILEDVVITGNTLEVRITRRGDFKYTTQFIGANGAILATDKSLTPKYSLRGRETYVRAKVTESGGATAWVQPVFTTRYRVKE